MIKIEFAYACCIDDISKIENYDKAISSNESYVLHHKLGIDKTREELIAQNLYYHRPAEELIFLSVSEHMSIHRKGKHPWNKGKTHSEDSRKKISNSKKGKPLSDKNRQNLRKHKTITDKVVEQHNLYKGKTWVLINGKRVWTEKQLSK